ncbi:MAG: two-component system response regulator [Planctomycetes bacterium RBG_19FT_COMBO_48_8]|nr:MAG: two-component system response regulator [Planctomycetes bacterium RBG_19FT_COMBO_48_8]
MQNSKPILLIEDDDVDVMTVKRAIRDLKVTNQLVSIGDGEEAIEYLRTENTTKPCIILLDLNMPKMDGAEFLKIVKADKALKKIPIVILTTSNSDRDVIESFERGAAGYMVKSVDYEKFVETIRAIDRYWTLSKLPSNGE